MTLDSFIVLHCHHVGVSGFIYCVTLSSCCWSDMDSFIGHHVGVMDSFIVLHCHHVGVTLIHLLCYWIHLLCYIVIMLE